MTFTTTTDYCPYCDGEGAVTVINGGTFDARAEQWYPREQAELCPDCGGTGEVVVCRVCGEEDRDCVCDEEANE